MEGVMVAAMEGLFLIAVIAIPILIVLAWMGSSTEGQRRYHKHIEDSERQAERRRMEEEVQRMQKMLYPDLSVEEAQTMVWAWEEMTDEERAAFPLERRVEMRKLREDLAAHKQKWGID